jgi:hypothetical protein
VKHLDVGIPRPSPLTSVRALLPYAAELLAGQKITLRMDGKQMAALD